MDFLEPNKDYTAEQINQFLSARLLLTDNLIILPDVLNQCDSISQLEACSEQAILLFQAVPAVAGADEKKQDTISSPQWYLACKAYKQGQVQIIDKQNTIGSELTFALAQYRRQLNSDQDARFEATDYRTALEITEQANGINYIECLLSKVHLFQLAHHYLKLPISFSVLSDYHLSLFPITETHFSAIKNTFIQYSQHQLTLAASVLDESDSLSSPEILGEYRFIRLVHEFPDEKSMQDATIYLQCGSKTKKENKAHYRFLDNAQEIIQGELSITSLTKDLQSVLGKSKIHSNVVKKYCCREFDTQEIVRLTQYKKQRHPEIYQTVLPDLTQKIAKGIRDWITQVNLKSNPALQILWPVYIPSTAVHRSKTASEEEKTMFTATMGEWYLVEWHVVLPLLEDCQVFLHSAYSSQGIPKILQIVVEGLHEVFRKELHTLESGKSNADFYQELNKFYPWFVDDHGDSSAASFFKPQLQARQPDAALGKRLSVRQQNVSSLSHKIFHHPGHLPLLRDGDTHSSGVAITTLTLLRLEGNWANQHPLPYSRSAWPLRLSHSRFWQAMTPSNQPILALPAWQQETETDLQATVINDETVWAELFPDEISNVPLSVQAEQAAQHSRGFYVLITMYSAPIYRFVHHDDFNLKRLVFTAAALGDVEMLEAVIDWSSVLTAWYEKLAAIKDPLRTIDIQLNNLRILEDGIRILPETGNITQLLQKGSIPAVIMEWFTYAFKVSLKFSNKFCDNTSQVWSEMREFVKGSCNLAPLENNREAIIDLIEKFNRYRQFIRRGLGDGMIGPTGVEFNLTEEETRWLHYLLQSTIAVQEALTALIASWDGEAVDVLILTDTSYYQYEITMTVELLKWLYTLENEAPNEDEKDEVLTWLIWAKPTWSLPQLAEQLTKQLEYRRHILQERRQERLQDVIEILNLDESKIDENSYYHEALVEQLTCINKEIKDQQKTKKLKQALSRLTVYNPCTVYLLPTKPSITNNPPNLSVCIYPLEDSKGSYEALITHSSRLHTTRVSLDQERLYLESSTEQFDWKIDAPWDPMTPWFKNTRPYRWDTLQDVRHRSTDILSHSLTKNYLYQQLRGVRTATNLAQMERVKKWVKSKYKLNSNLKIDTDRYGNTLLHTACYYGQSGVAAYLMETPFENLVIPVNGILPPVYSRRLLSYITIQYRSAYGPNRAQRSPHMIGFTRSLQRALEEEEEKGFRKEVLEQDIVEENFAPEWLINKLIASGHFSIVICWLVSSTQTSPIASLISSLSAKDETSLAHHVAEAIESASTDKAEIKYAYLNTILSHLVCQQSHRRATWGDLYQGAKSWKQAITSIPELHEARTLTWSEERRQLIKFDKEKQINQQQYMANHLRQSQSSWTLSASVLRQQLAPRHVPSDRALVLQTVNPWWNHELASNPAFKTLTRWIIRLMPQNHIKVRLCNHARCPGDITSSLEELEEAIQAYTSCQDEIYNRIDTNEDPSSLTDDASTEFNRQLEEQVIQLQQHWEKCRNHSDTLCRKLLNDNNDNQQTKNLLGQWRKYIQWQHRCKRQVLVIVLETVLQTYTSRLHAASNYGKYVREILCNRLEQWMKMQRGSHASDSVVMLSNMVDNEIETWVIAQLCEGLMAANEYVNDKPLTPRIQMAIVRLEQVLTNYSLPSITQRKQRKISAERKQAIETLLSQLKYYLEMQATAWEKVVQGKPQAWVYHLDSNNTGRQNTQPPSQEQGPMSDEEPDEAVGKPTYEQLKQLNRQHQKEIQQLKQRVASSEERHISEPSVDDIELVEGSRCLIL